VETHLVLAMPQTLEQFYSNPGTPQLRKDDGGDSSDDSSDNSDSSDDSSSSDSSSSDSSDDSDSDFNSKHPRWPAGTPKGGEFAPKDGAEASASDRSGISADDVRTPTGSTPKMDPNQPYTRDKDEGIDSSLIGGIVIPALVLASLPGDVVASLMAAGARIVSTVRDAQNVGDIVDTVSSDSRTSTAPATSATGEAASTTVDETASLPKPEGIPDNWVSEPSDGEGGIKYFDPNNPGNQVRIMPGSTSSPYPNSQVPNVRWLRDGQFLGQNGNPVAKRTPDAHIPLTNFKFDPKVYK
jgi:hypothetical protein